MSRSTARVRRGFTLVELLVVVLIIGVLAAIALPRFLGQKTRTRNAQAQVAVRQALTAARSWYSSDGRESYAGLCADASNARGESRCSGKTAISSLESSLGTAEPADNQTPGSGANPQDIWMGNGVSGSDPSGSTVTLCSVSRGDTVYCIRDTDGVASYYAFQGASVLAGADGSLYSATGWSTAITIDALVAGTPTVSGTATVGSQLSGSAGSWSGTTSSTAWSWVWRRCNSSGASCADIAGSSGTATGSGSPTIPAYTLVSADSGNTIRLQVQAQNGGGSCSLGVNCASADSAATSQVAITPVAGTPTVSGTATVGSNLTGSAGSWSGTSASTAWSWVWRRCNSSGASCADIAGASGTATGSSAPTISAYTLVSADSGNTIRLQVQAQNGGSCSVGTNCAVGTSNQTATITTPATLCAGGTQSATTQCTYSTPGTFTWTVPAGVSSVSVQAWGGGGSGSSSTGGPAGGSGGAYVLKSVTVSAGSSYTVTVGAGGAGALNGYYGNNGNSSWFVDTSTVLAAGGIGGSACCSVTQSAPATSSVGTTKYIGGNAGYGCWNGSTGIWGGGGGGGAGSSGNGGSLTSMAPCSGSGQLGASGGSGGGGAGGKGGSINTSAPVDGATPAGGGGGAGCYQTTSWSCYVSGAGGSGRVILTW